MDDLFIEVGGEEYEVVRYMSENRALVTCDDSVQMVDKESGDWEFSAIDD